MRYIAILIFTIIGLIGIYFYNPKIDEKLLSVFEDNITIDYSEIDTDDNWTYEIDNDNLEEVSNDNSIFKFKANNDGITNVIFYYQKEDEEYKYKIDYVFEIKDNMIYWKEGKTVGIMEFPKVY